MSKVKILIVEDESIVAIDIARRLKSLGYYVLGHTLSGEDAVLFSREKSPDLVLMDIHLKGEIDGITAAEQIRREYDIPVIYITAYSDESTLDRAKVTEPFGYILKPFQEREIHSAIEMAMYKHRAEQELREAKEAAEEGYRARSEFLANISHELRTPLNSILGMTKIAMETEDKDELQEYLKMAKDSGDHLLYLINSLLDFSKMEAGKLVLEEQPFQLDELMEEELYRVWSTEAGEELELYFALDEKSVFSLRGDESRLRQVVRNLVQNAAKFTPSGYVAVEAATRSNNRKGRVELEITVSDTGIGIPEKEKEEIFSLFYKVDNSLTMVHGGTGLGLSIVKNLTDLMGGKISLETEEEMGSSFTLTVPMKIDREYMRPPLSLPSGTRVRLVCENSWVEKARREQIEEWNGEVYIQSLPAIEGRTDDVWCVFGKNNFREVLKERLLEEGVPKEKIVVNAPLERGKSVVSGNSRILPFPGGRKKLFTLLKEAFETEVSKGKYMCITIDDVSAEKKEEAGSEAPRGGASHTAASGRAVYEMIGSFLDTGYKLLEDDNIGEIEETALQLKTELEQRGCEKLKALLFKVVLAVRKGEKAAVEKSLNCLKESKTSLTMEE
ncbi:MAG: hybrid sensor histidine kinase/response regulator [Spirochaetaceae bacterium]